MGANQGLAIASGSILSLIGSVCVFLAGWWLFVGDQVITMLSETPVALLLLAATYIIPQGILSVDDITNLPSLPDLGAELWLIVGVFVVLSSIRLISGAPGARLVAAYIHIIIGALVAIVLYLIIRAPIPWPAAGYEYSTWGVMVLLIMMHLGFALQLYQSGRDPQASRWSPFAPLQPCERCGRKKDEAGLCPACDQIHKQAYFVYRGEQEREFTVPSTIYSGEAIVIGRGDNADVFLDGRLIAEFATISSNHAKLTYNKVDGNYYIEDTSTHGTRIGGNDIKGQGKVPLPVGLEVHFANVSLVFKERTS